MLNAGRMYEPFESKTVRFQQTENRSKNEIHSPTQNIIKAGPEKPVKKVSKPKKDTISRAKAKNTIRKG